MYLKRLEIQGFKSFAHKTVLDFEPGITAVVGPNGSGKSNIADALRWVMGEQSLKLLRGKKSEDVIFAGSDKKSKLSMAEVSLTFDNKDGKLPYEWSEVVMSRRLYRNGESEYLINNQRVRLLDIVEALMRSGFGATNYAVIGQGTIDQMILAGPTEIKNLVEEAAGVKPYYMKRDKTIRRLEQTEENLSRVSELIKEIEPRLKSLKRQAKRMEERETIAAELSELQLEFFGHQFHILEKELGTITHDLDKKNAQVIEFEQEIHDFQKSLEKEEKASKNSSSFSEEVNKKISLLEDRRFLLTEQLAEIRGKIKAGIVPGQIDPASLNAERLDLERQIEVTEKKLKDVASLLESEQAAFDKLKKEVEEITKKIERARESRIDADALRKSLGEFEANFSSVLDGLRSDNVEDIKGKLKQLVIRIGQIKVEILNPIDLTSLLTTKDELSDQLHKLELKTVEYTTLKQNYQNNLSAWINKLNQIKTILKENPEQFKDELFKQEEGVNKDLEEVMLQMEELKKQQEKISDEEKSRRLFLSSEEKKFREKSSNLSNLKEDRGKLLVEKAKLDTRIEGLMKEATDALGLRAAEIKLHKKDKVESDLPNKVGKLKHQLELAGGVDESTMIEYKETQERFDYLSNQSADLAKAVVDLKAVIEELDQIITKQFDEAFKKISDKFSEYFRILFNGGRGNMSLLKASPQAEDGVEEFEGDEEAKEVNIDGVRPKKEAKEIVGIEIKATPPGKKLATIAALSGGERALTSIALLCSLLACYHSPFVVLDEVDAALDEANSIRFAKILGTLADHTQFITITHNRETMRQGHTLYGVTMSDEGISKILSLKLEQAEKVGARTS